MSWIADLLERFGRRRRHAAPAPPRLERDPDLDVIHREQHNLINRVAAHHLRDTMRERDAYNESLRRSWDGSQQ